MSDSKQVMETCHLMPPHALPKIMNLTHLGGTKLLMNGPEAQNPVRMVKLSSCFQEGESLSSEFLSLSSILLFDPTIDLVCVY